MTVAFPVQLRIQEVSMVGRQACSLFTAGAVAVGCSAEVASPTSVSSSAPVAQVVQPVVGIPDQGVDPAVVAIANRGSVICAGALVAEDLVLTARHCVSAVVCSGMPAPAAALPPLAVYVGDEWETAQLRATVRDIVVPPVGPFCDADVALLFLDAPVPDIVPQRIRSTGAAQGDHVRTVEWVPSAAGAIRKVVRDHVAVVATTATELALDEAPCESGCGGPAIDDATAQIVGVLSGTAVKADAGPSLDLAARTDVLFSWYASVLAQSAGAGSGTRARTKKGAVDVGANCSGAGDCAAGVCVSDAGRLYCSQTCSAHDRCPTSSRCAASVASAASAGEGRADAAAGWATGNAQPLQVCLEN
jgi:hypothetical protein